MPSGPAAAPQAGFVLVLVAATALGPFAMQVFLPALPAIQADFGVRAATAQLAFSLSALSIAVATLFYGPLSDRFGRRPALIGGLLVYLAGSLLCAVAPSITLLIVGRVVQAAGGCAGIVLSRAIVRDLYSRDQSASMLAYITMAMVAAPMMAPVLGGLLADLAGWRSVFVAGIGIGVLILVAVHVALGGDVDQRRPERRAGLDAQLSTPATLAAVPGLRPSGCVLDRPVLRLPRSGPLSDGQGAGPAGERVRTDVDHWCRAPSCSAISRRPGSRPGSAATG